MRERLSLASVALIAFIWTSCSVLNPAPVAEGSDEVVVHAERTAGYALDTFDSFLLWEHQNRTLLNNPGIKKAADNIRLNGKQWITDLRLATQAYKTARNQPNAQKLDIALHVVNQALEVARRYLLIKSTQPTS